MLQPLPNQLPYNPADEVLCPVQSGLLSAGEFQQPPGFSNEYHSTRRPTPSNSPAGLSLATCQGMPRNHASTSLETGAAAGYDDCVASKAAQVGQAASTALQGQHLKPPDHSSGLATAAVQQQAAAASSLPAVPSMQQGPLMTSPVGQQPSQGSFRFHANAPMDQGLLNSTCCTPVLANQVLNSCRSQGQHLAHSLHNFASAITQTYVMSRECTCAVNVNGLQVNNTGLSGMVFWDLLWLSKLSPTFCGEFLSVANSYLNAGIQPSAGHEHQELTVPDSEESPTRLLSDPANQEGTLGQVQPQAVLTADCQSLHAAADVCHNQAANAPQNAQHATVLTDEPSSAVTSQPAAPVVSGGAVTLQPAAPAVGSIDAQSADAEQQQKQMEQDLSGCSLEALPLRAPSSDAQTRDSPNQHSAQPKVQMHARLAEAVNATTPQLQPQDSHHSLRPEGPMHIATDDPAGGSSIDPARHRQQKHDIGSDASPTATGRQLHGAAAQYEGKLVSVAAQQHRDCAGMSALPTDPSIRCNDSNASSARASRQPQGAAASLRQVKGQPAELDRQVSQPSSSSLRRVPETPDSAEHRSQPDASPGALQLLYCIDWLVQ